MRIVVTGASGNVGTSLVRALAADDEVEEIVGLARRLPLRDFHETDWRATNIERDDLVPRQSSAARMPSSTSPGSSNRRAILRCCDE